MPTELMPRELTNSEINVHAEALLMEAVERISQLSWGDRYRVMRATADQFDDWLDDRTDPDA